MNEKPRILVPTIGTGHCRLAGCFAARIATQVGGHLTLLTAVNRRQQSRGQAVLVEAADMARGAAGEQKLSIETSLVFGQPASVIINSASEGRHDLVVMGSRPWHTRLRRLLGSTSRAVLAGAPCPVLLAKGDCEFPQNILLCDSGAASLRLIERFARALPSLLYGGCAVTVLHVMSQMGAYPGAEDWQLRADAQSLLDAKAPEGLLLAEDARLLKEMGVQPQVKVRHGLVVEQIMAESEEGNYDLVVIGAHRRQGWQDLLLDDLEEQIIGCLTRPVLVLR